MNKNRKTLLGLILVALVAVAGYFVWKSSQEKTSEEKGVVKIGVIMPLTGVVAEPGNNALRGIQLAVDNYNLSSQERQITLIVEDSKSDPRTGVSAINKLIHNDNCKIIIGDVMSSVFLACAPIAETNRVVMISPGASAPAVRDAGDYIFRNYLSDDFDGRVMATYMMREAKVKRVGVISVNNDYGNGVANTFKNVFSSLGGYVSFIERYSEVSPDFRTLALKVSQYNDIDALYLICSPPESALVVRKIKEQGLSLKLFGNLSFESLEFINNSTGAFDRIVFSAPQFNLGDSTNTVVQRFKEYYLKQYNVEPDLAAGLGYDVASVLIQSLKNRCMVVDELKDELYKIKLEGVTGYIEFDDKGDVLKDIQIKQVLSTGEITSIKKFSIQSN